MKKRFLALLLAAVCLFSVGCKFDTMTDEEARTFLREHLEEAKFLNDFFYGAGAPLAPGEEEKIDPSWTVAHYLPVDPSYRFQSVAEVKEAAEAIFTDEFLAPIYDYCFNGTDDFTSRYGEVDGHLTRDVTKAAFGSYAALDAESARVLEGTRYTCVVEVAAETATGGSTKTRINLSFDPDKGDWKFDSAVF